MLSRNALDLRVWNEEYRKKFFEACTLSSLDAGYGVRDARRYGPNTIPVID
jgi:hypothetical protein